MVSQDDIFSTLISELELLIPSVIDNMISFLFIYEDQLYPANNLAHTSSSLREALDTVRSLDRGNSMGVYLRHEF